MFDEIFRNWILKNEKACFFKIDDSRQHDYCISFSNCQNFHLLQNKFFKTAFAIDLCFNVFRNCKQHCQKFATFEIFCSNVNILSNLKIHKCNFIAIRRNLNRILKRFHEINSFVRVQLFQIFMKWYCQIRLMLCFVNIIIIKKFKTS